MIDTVTLSATSHSFEGEIPLNTGTDMTAVNQAFPTYTQLDSGSNSCYYKVASYSFKVNGALNDLSTYANWLTVSGTTAQIDVDTGNYGSVNTQSLTVVVDILCVSHE